MGESVHDKKTCRKESGVVRWARHLSYQFYVKFCVRMLELLFFFVEVMNGVFLVEF